MYLEKLARSLSSSRRDRHRHNSHPFALSLLGWIKTRSRARGKGKSLGNDRTFSKRFQKARPHPSPSVSPGIHARWHPVCLRTQGCSSISVIIRNLRGAWVVTASMRTLVMIKSYERRRELVYAKLHTSRLDIYRQSLFASQYIFFKASRTREMFPLH